MSNRVFVVSSQTRYIVPAPATTSSITSGYNNGDSISDAGRSIYGTSPNSINVNTNTTIDSIRERLSALEMEKNKKIDALDNK